MNVKTRIEELSKAINDGSSSACFALAALAHEFMMGAFDGYGSTTVAGPARVSKVSFRKNVEVAPYKHEHAEVTVEVNDGTFPEAVEMAKKLVDEALGVDVSREEYERALLTLERAKRAGFKASR